MFNRSIRRWPRPAAALLLVLLCAPPPAASHRAGSRPDGWKIYRNERYAFCVSYPADSRVQTRRDSHYQYSRIQNYDPATQPPGELAPGEYYVEVFIFDHRLGHRMDGRCAELLHEAHAVKVGKVAGWRGTTDHAEDGGGTPQAVCVESTKVDVLVKATESDPLGPLANRILDTVRFGI